MFSECTTRYADSTRSVFVFKIMFITGTSTAAVSAVFNQSRVSTFDIAFATGSVYGCSSPACFQCFH